MLAPDSVANIRTVLDQDRNAFPVWCVRALRLLLDELDAQRESKVGDSTLEEMSVVRRRIELAKQLLVEWRAELEKVPVVPADSDADHYKRGHAHAVQSCIADLQTVLTGGLDAG